MSRIKGIVFDVDGTLYSNTKLRLLISLLLLVNFFRSPVKFPKLVKIISSYRKSQEKLRENTTGNVKAAQIALTSKDTGCSPEEVETVVSDWFDTRPLKHLEKAARKNLVYIFKWIKSKDLKLGLLSDYPCREKAEALGLSEYIDVVLSAQDEGVNVFKPNPKGFEVIAEKLGLKPIEIIYIGDRAEIDVPGAVKTGMTAVIIGGKKGKNYISITNFNELKKIIEERI